MLEKISSETIFYQKNEDDKVLKDRNFVKVFKAFNDIVSGTVGWLTPTESAVYNFIINEMNADTNSVYATQQEIAHAIGRSQRVVISRALTTLRGLDLIRMVKYGEYMVNPLYAVKKTNNVRTKLISIYNDIVDLKQIEYAEKIGMKSLNRQVKKAENLLKVEKVDKKEPLLPTNSRKRLNHKNIQKLKKLISSKNEKIEQLKNQINSYLSKSKTQSNFKNSSFINSFINTILTFVILNTRVSHYP